MDEALNRNEMHSRTLLFDVVSRRGGGDALGIDEIHPFAAFDGLHPPLRKRDECACSC